MRSVKDHLRALIIALLGREPSGSFPTPPVVAVEQQTSVYNFSHTFLIDNHVRLHSSQNASYTEDVCDMHLRLTAKPHLCVICSTFHT